LSKVAWIVAALVMAGTPSVAGADGKPLVAVLPLAANDTGIPYSVLPSPSELSLMTGQLRAGLVGDRVSLVVQGQVARAASAAGFDQTVPARSCTVAECAQSIGRAVHADEVVVGAVTRQMAVIWGTSFSIIDVRTGRVLGAENFGYKGDVQAMELGERTAGGCIGRFIRGQKPCPPDRGW
jgi:Protein of unknown function (DUF2380)